jgi:deoxycytidine triphosphate deaminase
MGIKSDAWIRKMAVNHKMVDPFVDAQVQQGVISYGLSSYGYDIRVADEFKIFTNINSTIVDPKKFDPKSFVDHKGEICLIPPNSFALARSVEYFRIPRNIVTICIGKCVTADTRVVDAETGAYLSITEFAWGKKTLGMRNWQLEPARVAAFLPQGRKPVFELRTRAGLQIRATANHPFRQLHGWTPLSELKPGNRVAVAREIPVFGKTPLPDWEAILLGLMISEGQCHTPGRSPTFTSADPVLVKLLKRCVEQGGGAARWLESSYGLNVTAERKFVPQAIFTAPKETVRLFLQALFSGDGGVYHSGDGFCLEYYSNSRQLIEDVHHLLLRFGVFSLIREKRTQVGTWAYRIQITDREQILRFAQEIGFWPGSIKQLRLEREILPALRAQPMRLRSNFDTLPATAWPMLNAAAARRDVSLLSLGVPRTQPSQSLPYTLAAQVAYATEDEGLLPLLDGPVWDVVEEITPAGEEEVYDLSIPILHNFVANDIIVHNSTYARCGIIVNVTPFEPEWEGFPTLEISNTTPLPAKIYANEGIAQVMFFEPDEVCQISYADKKGKYQKQTGITLPKI